MTGPGKATVETLQRLVDAFNAHDLDAVMSFFVDDPVLEMPRGPDPWGQRFQGREAVRSGLASRFSGLPDVHYGEDRHWVCLLYTSPSPRDRQKSRMPSSA